MTREEAERERDRLAEEHPEATWIAAEKDGSWEVLKVGIGSGRGKTSPAVENKPRPPLPGDPHPQDRDNPYLF